MGVPPARDQANPEAAAQVTNLPMSSGRKAGRFWRDAHVTIAIFCSIQPTSDPFVLGTSPLRGSRLTACRSALAVALKIASAM